MGTPKGQLKEPLLTKMTTAVLNDNSQQYDVNRLLKDQMTKQLYYGSDEYLSNPDKAKSSDFLENITYQIDLSKLYKIVSTCYCNQNMPYCPILVQNTREDQKYRYQLQVWDGNQQMIYERDLHEPPVAWFVTFNTLIYKPAPTDQLPNEDCYFIIFLYKGNSYMKVNVQGTEYADIQKPRIGFSNRCLYISSDSMIYIINCIQTVDLKPGQFEMISHFDSELRLPIQISLGEKVKNHGFILNFEEFANDYLIMCCETSDNQIDFSLISYRIKDRSYTIKQIQEVIARDRGESGEELKRDKIIMIKQVQTKKWPYAVVLRQSGKVDFYWNYLRIGHAKSDQEQKLTEKCLSVDVNFKSFFLKFLTQTKQISLSWNGRIGLDVAEDMDKGCVYKFQNAFQQMISEKVNFYNTSALINTSFFIAHNNLIFMYDIIQQEWNKEPYVCDQKVMKLFRYEKESGAHYHVGVMLEDGSFDNLENTDLLALRTCDWQHKSIQDKPRVQGKIKQIVPDMEHYRLLYILFEREEDRKYHMQLYTRNQLHNLDKITDLNESSVVFPLFQPSQDSMFIVHSLYPTTQSVLNNTKTLIDRISISTYDLQLQIYSASFKLDKNKKEIMRCKQVNSIAIQIRAEDGLVLKQDVPYVALTQDMQDHIVLIGKKNAYKLDLENGEMKVITDSNISGIQMIDNNHCYAIINNPDFEHKKHGSQAGQDTGNLNVASGLKYFSLKMLIESLESRFLDIDVTVAGPHSFVDYSEDNERITYLKSFEKACIIPILHRTTINFMGMLPRSSYLAVKKIKNTFLALDKQNRITVWNVLTGKLLSEHRLKNNQDFSGYEVFGARSNDMTYQREWFQPKILIVDTSKSFDVFSHSQAKNQSISNEIKSGVAFIYSESIAYNMYRQIEIENETTVKEHCHFIHSNYQEKFQRLFLSSDLDIMIEILVNLRVNIYTSQQDPKEQGGLKWVLLRRFQDFPHDLAQVSESLFMFSADLKNYINFDKVKGLFFIKNTLDSNQTIQIPQKLMNPQIEEPKESVRRFKWIGTSHILIANKYGYETLFSLEGDLLREVSSSMIPAFKSVSLSANHIYMEPEALELGDVVNRLLRKYRELKRTRYLFEKEYQIQIYDQLFEVDFNVGRGKYKHVSNLSFSFISWKVMEDIVRGKIKMEYMDQDILMILCLNILPGCQTILHKLANKSQLLQKLFSIVPIYTQRKLSELQRGVNSENTMLSYKPPRVFEFEMPFISDLNNKTPLHHCLDNKDFKTADLFIQFLADAPIDHHGKALKGLLHKLIEQELPSLKIYFEKRRIQSESIQKINRGHILGRPEHKDLSFTVSSLWVDTKHARNQLFSNDSVINKKKNIQSDVELYFIDLPDYHFLNRDDCQAFFDSLKSSSRLDLFEIPTIRYLIDYAWPDVRLFTRRRLFYPYIFYLVVNWIQTNIIYDYYKIDGDRTKNGVVFLSITMATLCIMSVYFLVYEYKQMKSAGLRDYLSSPWNYIDLTPPIIIISQTILTCMNTSGSIESIIQTIQSLSSMLLWIKLLYFFRMNRSTGYLIRMVAKVFVGIKTFLGVLLITIVAFGDGFTSLQDSKYQDNLRAADGFFSFIYECLSRFLSSCFSTYNMILGEFSIMDDFDSSHKFVSIVLFILCTLFVMIVMLNLLISIIGQVYSDVQENQVNEFYQEKATIIAENNYLIPDEVILNKYSKGHYLLVAKKVNEEVSSESQEAGEQDKSNGDKEDTNQVKQKDLEKKLDKFISVFEKRFGELEYKIDARLNQN